MLPTISTAGVETRGANRIACSSRGTPLQFFAEEIQRLREWNHVRAVDVTINGFGGPDPGGPEAIVADVPDGETVTFRDRLTRAVLRSQHCVANR